MNSTEQIHNSLRSVLLNGRIMLNGNPLSANELSSLIQGEQLLFEKASKFDVERAGAKAPDPKDPTIIPIKKKD